MEQGATKLLGFEFAFHAGCPQLVGIGVLLFQRLACLQILRKEAEVHQLPHHAGLAAQHAVTAAAQAARHPSLHRQRGANASILGRFAPVTENPYTGPDEGHRCVVIVQAIDRPAQ